MFDWVLSTTLVCTQIGKDEHNQNSSSEAKYCGSFVNIDRLFMQKLELINCPHIGGV